MSTAILPIKPGNTTGVNDGNNEALRLAFLTRFLNNPNRFSVSLTLKDYLNSPLSGPENYEYKWVSQLWKKGAAVGKKFTETELYILICNFETTSFCKDVVGILLEDMKHNKETQKTLFDATDINDQVTRKAIWAEYTKFRNMENGLTTYKNDFLTYANIKGEFLPTLEVLLAVDE